MVFHGLAHPKQSYLKSEIVTDDFRPSISFNVDRCKLLRILDAAKY